MLPGRPVRQNSALRFRGAECESAHDRDGLMHTTELTEARIEDADNILVAPEASRGDEGVRDFFGAVVTPEELASGSFGLAGKTVYLWGDVSGIDAHAAGCGGAGVRRPG